ncbi:ADP-ribosylglycohydrolase family protein [Undibacterium sp. TC4M20W]|uniref:ADP-ribosylglycohydrolase family protein n=1 Tax=Undibacterium sp. TC4M20W TaxID=3413052 RepID=UPI003BF21FD6
MPVSASDAIAGCLMGGAVGDAMGLPFEGLSPRRITRLRKGPLQYRFFFGHGMVSDDTDHAIFVTQSLIKSEGDVSKFKKSLAWRLRLWLICLPAGVGFATLRSIIKLWLGFKNNGVYSAGNGPSMRSAMIGAILSNDASARHAHVLASTLLTHTDPKAFTGALAIAEIAARLVNQEWQTRPPLNELISMLSNLSDDAEWQAVVKGIKESCLAPDPVLIAQNHFGGKHGISGYTMHTVPFAIIAWYLHFGSYYDTIDAVVNAGGDVDSVAAIAGALAGASVGLTGIPQEWRDGLMDWPHSRQYLQTLARKVNDPEVKAGLYFSFWLFPRNIIFLVIVLLHGFRRLLPPY